MDMGWIALADRLSSPRIKTELAGVPGQDSSYIKGRARTKVELAMAKVSSNPGHLRDRKSLEGEHR
jgi:hypothetical protein